MREARTVILAVICAAWPLALPVTYYRQTIYEMRNMGLKIGSQPTVYLEPVLRHAYRATVVSTFLACLLACVLVLSRRNARRLLSAATLDTAMMALLFISPWIVVVAVRGDARVPPWDAWVPLGTPATMAAICVVASTLSCWVLAKLWRPSGLAA